jgi:hypothetical protein
MFKCYNCKELSQSRDKAYSVVLKTRDKSYENYRRSKFPRGYRSENEEDSPREKIIRTKGWEIVQEEKFCKSCYEKTQGENNV